MASILFAAIVFEPEASGCVRSVWRLFGSYYEDVGETETASRQLAHAALMAQGG